MTTTARSAAPSRPSRKLGYQPGLDGLRAVSVAAVLLYHADVSWMPGGFLGVEVFFVVSGFLITSLIVEERHHDGGVSLRGFWTRRARRLLPALYVLLAVVSVMALVFWRDAAGRLGSDVLAAMAYVYNWWQIVLDESYFAQAGRPPLLQHVWSLAVEEQFYLLFPPLFLLLMARLGHRRTRWILVAVAIASTVEMAILFDPVDPSRVYYGTDTRLSGLLLGAVLALTWAPWRARGRPAPGARHVMNGAGLMGLVLLAWFFTRVNEFDPFVYHGGFLALDVVCLVVIAVVVHPASAWGRLLGLKPLEWLGRRSYSIYLWHWPIFVVTRPELDVPLTGFPLFVLRIALTMCAAELSYRFVEQPLRRGALGRWWRRWKSAQGMQRTFMVRRASLVVGAGATVIVLVAFGLYRAATNPERELLAMQAAGIPEEVLRADGAGAAEAAIEAEDGGRSVTSTTTVPTSTVGATATTAPDPSTTSVPTIPGTTNAVAVGDSVLLGARQQIESAMPGIRVDAKVGRQFTTLLQVVQWYVQEGYVQGPLIVHAGTNGTLTDEDLDRLFEIAGDRKVLLINAKVARPWQDLVNGRIAAAAQRHPNAILVDWFGLASQHPEWFTSDGAHLRPDGATALAELIRSKLP